MLWYQNPLNYSFIFLPGKFEHYSSLNDMMTIPPPSPDSDIEPSWMQLLFASAHASACFALACLEPIGKNLRAYSSFVDPKGKAMTWHDFGCLEGPGWAANAIGGAHLLWKWGHYLENSELQESARRIVFHILEDGFVRPDGLVFPYFHLKKETFCLNYTHNDDWLCPGSLARIGVQMVEFSDENIEDDLSAALRRTASQLSSWLTSHVPLLPNGWVPRRITPQGQPYSLSPSGGSDPIFMQSADGLSLLQLYLLTGKEEPAFQLGKAFIDQGGFWGSINHDTFDFHENVAYAVAFRVLRQAAEKLHMTEWRDFAYQQALDEMSKFRLTQNIHGVYTQGLFFMEKSWDTAYLWENAEVAQAFLEAWQETSNAEYCQIALDVLKAIACHHYGDQGFLTEGVDWNNHVGQRHHINYDYYGAIRYTEPLLNNLHLLLPTLTYFRAVNYDAPLEQFGIQSPLLDHQSKVIQLLSNYQHNLSIFLFQPGLP